MARYVALCRVAGSNHHEEINAGSLMQAREIAERRFPGDVITVHPEEVFEITAPHAATSRKKRGSAEVHSDGGSGGFEIESIPFALICFSFVVWFFVFGKDSSTQKSTQNPNPRDVSAQFSIPQSEYDRRNAISFGEINNFNASGNDYGKSTSSNADRRIVWYTMGANTDLPGNDISSKPIKTSSTEDCGQLCLNDPNCMAFTFNARAKACFIKFKKGDVSFFSGAESGYVVGR